MCVSRRRHGVHLSFVVQVEAENLIALKYACETNAYDSCVELIDELLTHAVSEMQLQASALGFGDIRE